MASLKIEGNYHKTGKNSVKQTSYGEFRTTKPFILNIYD